eukprot:2471022-Rhodomonas_salina.3
MSGTAIQYGATCLRTCFAMRSTAVAYGQRACYAMCGTELAYGGQGAVVLARGLVTLAST